MSTVFEPSQAQERWLECKLDKGMFSDEFAVTYPPEGHVQKSVFVAANSVERTTAQRGRVLVRVITKNGNLLAVLPSANRDIVSVQPRDITDK